METFQLAGSGPALYEKHLVPLLFEPLGARLVGLVAPALSAADLPAAVDVACGTGAVARRLAALEGVQVTGVDVNADMLAVAGSISPTVTWVEGDAQALPLPAGAFDLAVCQQGLQFMPDPGAALRSIIGALRPGGRLAAALWRPLTTCPGFNVLTAALDFRVGPAAGDVLRGPFVLGEPEPVAELVSRAGFRDVRVHGYCHPVRFGSVDELVRSEIASTPLAAMVPEETVPVLVADVGAALADYVADDGVLFPICAYIVTGTRPLTAY